MHKPELCLFRHPTTTVFVDDSEDFLYSIALGVDRLPYRSFSNPAQGLAYVNQFPCSIKGPLDQSLPGSNSTIDKLFSRACGTLTNTERFAEPAVLIVDYNMPGMNGLDLCAQITNPNIKKVLLTGTANERLAIDALNIELIDFYVSKREKQLAHRLQGIIAHLETRYFQDLYGWSRDSESRATLPLLFDTAFADYFEEVMEKLDTVEYYPLLDNSGFRLINGYGQCTRLVVFSEAELSRLIQDADTSRLSPAKRQKLEQHQLIPVNPNSLSEDQLLSPTIVEGSQRWHCALFNDGCLEQTISYQQFLKTPQAFHERAYAGS